MNGAAARAWLAAAEAEALRGGGDAAPAPVGHVAVIGAGTMGSGLAMALANGGLRVTLVDSAPAGLERGLSAIRRAYEGQAARGRITSEEAAERSGRIAGTRDLAAAAETDAVIEAVFEDLALKREIFAALDRTMRPGALLATNTSGLDIDAIAAATARPGDVVGMHFFSPAHVMRLVEVVRGRATSPAAIATTFALARRLNKVPVLVGNAPGFVGNRMMRRRGEQAERLLLEGTAPERVDGVLRRFGFPMGPFAMLDMAGLDVGLRARRERGATAAVDDALNALGRLGQKTGAGYYRYVPGDRTPHPDPAVTEVAREAAARLGIPPREAEDEEILDRLLLPMVNEGARILEEGMAARPGDIDVVWAHGYGFPPDRGGPMYHADAIGLPEVARRLAGHAARTGDPTLRPAPLLERLAAEGASFTGAPR
ncbi:3-hydroxyacyl-CoA dehydrogenase [Muricoccus aerilatus]|uniref:3-hydroxyacyl-CoA dehydrogenase n=1 Tax=Muricoccus aerilatus TaxID=452982 RepID=UPI000693915A|nr:3-hydroxyacyl-CoA dehydrogenase [Roseomonas aerilata]